MTGKYPFDDPTPPIKAQPKDPKQFKGCADLSSSLVNVLVKMIAPERKDRFASAEEFLTAMAEVKRLRSVLTAGEIGAGPKVVSKLGFEPTKPNTNPFVTHLLTLYSQSQVARESDPPDRDQRGAAGTSFGFFLGLPMATRFRWKRIPAPKGPSVLMRASLFTSCPAAASRKSRRSGQYPLNRVWSTLTSGCN
ncbi:hypothetical protein R1479_04502 [Ralstonia mannitolilytica]|uniref:hypothetical protein n=1 Tax=Ralstonia mannitolilytica TaxID=105219 RepID=UPI0028F65504|nr:hypothetical protein [Ralstonia mannitolilytica]CAJ0900505.1 hypothetical protein R1479_04502 [Ralstonia mannitolilytica]